MHDLIASSKANAVRGMNTFLHDLSHVPDDKLNWSPSPTAKSALQIAAHCAVTVGNFAEMIQARKLPQDVAEHVAQTAAAEAALTSRAEIEALYRANTDAVVAALDTLTPEEVAMSLESSLGWSMPMTFLMELPWMHAISHAGQIVYLQTCWGDLEIRF